MRAEYINISILKALSIEIDKLIFSSKIGYKSRTELITEGIRDFFLRRNIFHVCILICFIIYESWSIVAMCKNNTRILNTRELISLWKIIRN